jgi:hypothetical protein
VKDQARVRNGLTWGPGCGGSWRGGAEKTRVCVCAAAIARRVGGTASRS